MTSDHATALYFDGGYEPAKKRLQKHKAPKPLPAATPKFEDVVKDAQAATVLVLVY
ncbi:MAG TPA: hypothetical protein VED19_01685 [Candidatus Nitrosopolaris sp.]|nr:hypothetical protein [Candidatus Nitrosopolaris sp.]